VHEPVINATLPGVLLADDFGESEVITVYLFKIPQFRPINLKIHLCGNHFFRSTSLMRGKKVKKYPNENLFLNTD